MKIQSYFFFISLLLFSPVFFDLYSKNQKEASAIQAVETDITSATLEDGSENVTFNLQDSDKVKVSLTPREFDAIVAATKKQNDSETLTRAVEETVQKLMLKKQLEKKRYFKKRYLLLLLLFIGGAYGMTCTWDALVAENVLVTKLEGENDNSKLKIKS